MSDQSSRVIHQILHPNLKDISLSQFLKRLGDLNKTYEKDYTNITVSFRGPDPNNQNCCVELSGVPK
jgi:hypothetical protein